MELPRKTHFVIWDYTKLHHVSKKHFKFDWNCPIMMQIKDITFSADTGHILDCTSRTTGPFSGNAFSLLLNLPQVAGGVLAGNGLY